MFAFKNMCFMLLDMFCKSHNIILVTTNVFLIFKHINFYSITHVQSHNFISNNTWFLTHYYSKLLYTLLPPVQPHYCNSHVLLLQDGSLERLAKESELLEKHYGHFFDYKIVNNDISETIDKLEQAIDNVCSTPQWVPVSWVYWTGFIIVPKYWYPLTYWQGQILVPVDILTRTNIGTS